MAVMQPSWNISLSINLYHCYVTGIHATRSTTIKELHSFLGRNAGIFRGRKKLQAVKFLPFLVRSMLWRKKKERKEEIFANIYPREYFANRSGKKIEKETGSIDDFVRIYIWKEEKKVII